MEKEQVLNKAFKISIILILTIGVLLRLKYFLDFRWLWGDEIRLLENIYCRDIFSAAFGQLTREQSAPPLFLLFSKLIMEIFRLFTPHFLLSLRIIPFIASIISVFGFYILSTKYLKNKINIITANILFCFNMHLIFFGQIFKQYSSDVCLFILILLSFFYIDFEKLSKKAAIGLGLAYAICPWFSFTSIFVIPGVIAAIISKYFNKEQLQNKDFIKKTLGLIVPFIVSFIILYVHQKYAVAADKFFIRFWYKGFIHAHDPLSIFRLIFNAVKYYLWEPDLWVKISYSIILVVGLLKILLNLNKQNCQIIILSFICILIASALYIYPFTGRIALYFYPAIIIAFIIPFDFQIKSKLINIIPIIFMVISLFITIKYQETFTHKITNFKFILKEYLQRPDKKSNDYLVFRRTTADNYYTFTLYNSIFHFAPPPTNTIVLKDYKKEYFDKLPSGNTYYILNTVSKKIHMDRTNRQVRENYLKYILSNLRETKILDIKQDENYNYIIKFTK